MSGKQHALALLPKVTGAISMTFSSMILFTIAKKVVRHKRKISVYDRLVMGMSVADWLASVGMFLSTWPIPRETGVLWAVGNQASCNFQGVFTQGPTSAATIYNSSLTFYFLLVVLFQWKQTQFRRYEFCFHVVPIMWGLSTAISGIPLKLYNNANLWCWIAPGEEGRGENAHIFRMLFFYGPLYLILLIVTINEYLIIRYVRRLTHKIIHRSSTTTCSNGNNVAARVEEEDDDDEEGDDDENFLATDETDETQSICSSPHDESGSSRLKKDKQANRYIRMRQRVALQNLRFTLAFYFTWLPISCVRVIQLTGQSPPFWLTCLATITTPLQGLPNLLVYCYPKYLKYRKANQKRGFMSVFKWIQAGMETVISDQVQHKSDSPRAEVKKEGSDTPTNMNAPPQVEEDIEAKPNNQHPSTKYLLPSVSSITASELHIRQKPLPQPRKSLKKYKKRPLVSSVTLASGLETIHETKDVLLAPPARVASEFSSLAEEDKKSIFEGPIATSQRPPTTLARRASTDSAPALPSRLPDCSYSSESDSIHEQQEQKEPIIVTSQAQRRASSDSIPALPLRLFSVFSTDSTNETILEEQEASETSIDSKGLEIPPPPMFSPRTSAGSTLCDSTPGLPKRAASSCYQEDDDVPPPPMLSPRTSSGTTSFDSAPGLPKRPSSSCYEDDDDDDDESPVVLPPGVPRPLPSGIFQV